MRSSSHAEYKNPKGGEILMNVSDHRYDIWVKGQGQMDLVARKPVFGVSVKASFKPVSSATETS